LNLRKDIDGWDTDLGGALRDKSAPASFYEDFALAAFLTFSTDAADVNAAFGQANHRRSRRPQRSPAVMWEK
jgi:hypothetical protein